MFDWPITSRASLPSSPMPRNNWKKNAYVKLLRLIDRASTGFVYLTSDYGTTGKRDRIGGRAFDFVKRAKNICINPVGVGFGVSKAEHVKSLVDAGADGVIVGSALVELIEIYEGNAGEFIDEKVRELAKGLM